MVVAVWVIVVVPSRLSSSCAAVTVTVCVVAQFVVVKVRVSWLPVLAASVSAVMSLSPLVVTVTVTLVVGAVDSQTE